MDCSAFICLNTTSLKSQKKFTACICFYKFRQIKKYFFIIFSYFIQTLECYFYDSLWFSCFIQDLECFITIYLKIFMFYQWFWWISCFIQDLEWCFITFYLIHVLSMILIKFLRFFMFYLRSWMISYCILFIKYSCFINDFDNFFKIFHVLLNFFHVLFKMLNDVYYILLKKYSCFIHDFDEFFKILKKISRIFKIFHGFIFFHHFTMI